MTKAPAPIKGGMICPPEDATASTAAANALGYPRRVIAGSVNEPVDATFAEAEPEMEPKRADESTETFAAPPFSFPAVAVAKFLKPWPASPACKTAPKDRKSVV